MILFGNRKMVSDSTGFDVTKEIISEYNAINIIESKGVKQRVRQDLGRALILLTRINYTHVTIPRY